ncbi:MAG: S9 family peptidase [Pseudoxanthomonas sp.]|nr:S9 family peptidase [Pseudoxanthomonas sp.]
MRFGFLLALCLAGAGLSATAPLHAQVDLVRFEKPDTFDRIKLSPTGEYYAATVPLGERTAMTVLRRSDNAVLAQFALGDESHVEDFHWVNDERLLLSMSRTYGSADQPFLTGELIAVDYDGGNLRVLAGSRAQQVSATRIGTREQQNVAAFLVHQLPAEKHTVLVKVQPFHDDPYPTLETLDVRTGRRIQVARSPIQHASFGVDHVGELRFIWGLEGGAHSVLRYRDDKDAQWQVINDESKTRRVERPVGFSPDNRTAYLQVDDAKGTDRIIAFDTQSGERRSLLQHEMVDPDRILYSLSQRGVPVGAQYMGESIEQRFFDPQSPEARLYAMLQSAFKGQAVRVTSATDDGKLAMVSVSSASNPGDFYLFEVDTRKAHYLLSRRNWIDPQDMGEVRPVTLKARDGLVLHGYLTLPPGSDGKGLPMVVNPHGGPFWVHDRLAFNSESQILAHAGYAVLQVNFRGSGNYGRRFSQLGAGQWGRTMQDDLTDATRWAIEQGIADKDRVCIYGASYGAYAALMGVAREPGLYQCAAGLVGVYDVDRLVRDDQGGSRFLAHYSSSWIGEPGTLSQVSPVRLAGQVKVPVFLAAGGEDERVDFKHSELMQEALEAAGVPVETLYFANEGHGFYKQENRLAYYRQLLGFLSRHLGGRKAE